MSAKKNSESDADSDVLQIAKSTTTETRGGRRSLTAVTAGPSFFTTAGTDRPLEHDLSQMAARLHKSNSPNLGPTAISGTSTSNRPLQIHLDVAAVEHDIEAFADDKTSTPPQQQPGLLSQYLQLANVDHQQRHLGIQSADMSRSKQKKLFSSSHQNKKKRATRASSRSHTNVSRLTKLRSRMRNSNFQRNNRNIGWQETQSYTDTASADDQKPTANSNLTSEKITQVTDSIEQIQQLSSPKKQTLPALRIPMSDTDLTQFLPYALSTPGIQSMVGTPSQSRTNSSDDLGSWVSRRGNVLDAINASISGHGGPASKFQGKPDMVEEDEITNEKEGAILDEKRLRLLEGIHKLLLHQRFICLLAQAMMQYGAPLHHLEDNLSRMALHLGLSATFSTMPGLIIISFEDTTTFTSDTKIIRCPNGIDMHRLELTDKIFRRVSKGEIDVEPATEELTNVMCAPPLYAWYWQLLDWGVAAWSVCLMAFSGSWMDSLAAFILGLMAGSLNLLASRLKGYTNLFEVSLSILCGFFATVFERWLCFGSVTLSGTVVLLPGLLLNTGVIELASRNMHAGTIRSAYALMLAFIIAFGIKLGNDIYVEIFNRPDRVPDMNIDKCSPISPWWWWLTLPTAVSSICVLINVHPRRWHACIIVAGIMFSVFWVLAIHLKLKVIGTVVAAFVLGIAANIWSKVFNHNAFATLLPGMMILVPGSIGVRGIMSMLNTNEGGGSSGLVIEMFQTSLSIMTGLFASSFIIYPRGKKQSALMTV